MQIPTASDISAFKAAETQQKVGTAVLKKSLDVAKAQGQAAISLLESAAETFEAQKSSGRGGFDIKI